MAILTKYSRYGTLGRLGKKKVDESGKVNTTRHRKLRTFAKQFGRTKKKKKKKKVKAADRSLARFALKSKKKTTTRLRGKQHLSILLPYEGKT